MDKQINNIKLLSNGDIQFKTTNPVPGGALEEVSEIFVGLPSSEDNFIDQFIINPPRLLAINLTGHGCILIAKDIEILKELQKHKDNCFVQRPIPEVVGG